jgi:hypothetical protein
MYVAQRPWSRVWSIYEGAQGRPATILIVVWTRGLPLCGHRHSRQAPASYFLLTCDPDPRTTALLEIPSHG